LPPDLKIVGPSSAYLCLYVGLKEDAKTLGLRQSNLWIHPSYDHDANIERFLADPTSPFPLVYVSFPSAKDPSWDQNHPGTATIEVITLARMEWFEKWKNTKWRKRGDDYEAKKKYWADRLLKVLYEHVPQVQNKVDYAELSTPLSTLHFNNCPFGETYGLDHTPERFKSRSLAPRTQIKRLYLTGQDITSCGVSGAMMGGVLTASVILKRNLLKDLM